MSGIWSSRTPNIATITPEGIVTTKAVGQARFTFVQNGTGCVHNPTAQVSVLDRPRTNIEGLGDICVNSTAQLLPSIGGVWTTLNPEYASVTSNGLVTGVSMGTARFVFVENGTLCSSDSSLQINIGEAEAPTYDGLDTICLGYKSIITSNRSTISWISDNPSIAKISSDGVFTGIAPGKVNFRYIDISANCTSAALPKQISIRNCVDPDFNVTLTNYWLNGDVSTNDDIIGTKRYDQAILVSKPENSTSSIFVYENGKFTFRTDKPGKYIYKVPVCINSDQFGCPSMVLEITAVDPSTISDKTISNLDIGTMYPGSQRVFNTLFNDRIVGKSVMPSITWTSNSKINNNSIWGTSNLNYQCNVNTLRFGMDTITYSICDTNSNQSDCNGSTEYIILNTPSALNSVVGADDFTFIYSGQTATIDLLGNDMDPESDNFTINPIGSRQEERTGQRNTQIFIPEGSYSISNSGLLTFTADPDFYGTVDIPYEICDNNLNQECTKATAHILVIGDMSIRVKFYLEGALINNNNARSSSGAPLMRDDLRYSHFNGKRCIPNKSPYHVNPYGSDFNLPILYPKVNEDTTRGVNIEDTTGVFSVTGENAIVDWVYIQIRDKRDNKNIIATRAGLLQRDGDVVDLDGISPLSFAGLNVDSFYIMAKHRNHLGVMSGLIAKGDIVDFTNPRTKVFNYGTTLNNNLDYSGLSMNSDAVSGYTALWAGDATSNGLISYSGEGDDRNIIFGDVVLHPKNSLLTSNFDFTYGYFQGDFNLNAKVKHDNPDDDTNFLFGQVILYSLNSNYLSNFGLFIEQVPK
jgi:hypothetical protein